MKTRLLTSGVLALSLVACAGEPGAPTGDACESCDQLSEDFDATYRSVVGEYEGTTAEGDEVSAAVMEAGTSRNPQLSVQIDASTVALAPVRLSYDAELDRFIGFEQALCDDPGCVQIDSLFVTVAVVDGEATVGYRIAATGFAGDEASDDVSWVEEGELTIAPASFAVTFEEDSQWSSELQALVTQIIEEDCNTSEFIYSTIDEVSDEEFDLDGNLIETIHFADLAVGEDFADATFISIAEIPGPAGSSTFELIELSCPR